MSFRKCWPVALKRADSLTINWNQTILMLSDRAHPVPAQVSCLNVTAKVGLCYLLHQ